MMIFQTAFFAVLGFHREFCGIPMGLGDGGEEAEFWFPLLLQ